MIGNELFTNKSSYSALHQAKASPLPLADRAIQLNEGQAGSIGRKAQFLRVISRVRSREAWVTIDGEDIILSGEENITLESRKSRAVITAVGENPPVYEVR